MVSRSLVWTGSAGAALLTAHAALNARLLRVPPLDPPSVRERVSLLLPLRDEAHRVAPCLRALLAQQRLDDVELLVLDDGSTDGTGDVVRRIAGEPVLLGRPLPPGWLGKPWACAQLAAAATGTVLVFVDADVVLTPTAVARTIALLRGKGWQLVSPYPRQRTETVAERLVQPLLQWSWLTFLPLRLAERSPRPSLAAANGQLLAVDAAAYRTAGGHTGVRAQVVEDVELLKALKRNGFCGAVVDGTDLAVCQMYDGWRDLRDGYTKSLWAAFGSPYGALTAGALLGWLYLVPPLAALRGSRIGALGYAAAVAGRVVAAERTGGRALPDALAHPLSIVMLLGLLARSWLLRSRGRLEWKGRRLPGPGPQG